MTDTPLIFIDESGDISEVTYDRVREIYKSEILGEPTTIRAGSQAIVCGPWAAVGLHGYERVLTREQAIGIYGPEIFLNLAPAEPVEPRWLGIERNLPRDLPDPPPLRNRKERRRWAAKHRA